MTAAVSGVFAWAFAAATAVFKTGQPKPAAAKQASAQFWAAVASSGAGTGPFKGFAK